MGRRPPSFGRPQSNINPYLDECDLFVGILWEKWGTPPGGDVTYSSGFEEEFERTRERRDKNGNGAPDIWLFLKEVSRGSKKKKKKKRYRTPS